MKKADTIEAIDFPINQAEQAHLRSRKNFLAQTVFKKISDLLRESVSKVPEKNHVELDELRSHEAILVHGGRGTGKSSVLVNLRTYMNAEDELKNRLLILKPIDPTLLANGEDLLLNIIVAALMRDLEVKEALQRNDEKAAQFYDQLHRLGTALEGIQKQKEQFGLDKLRAFIGNQDLAEHVHRLFKCTVEITEKSLIVLPIDDVDTSLDLAFENIEVVRKYLTSPYVVPIISGDLDLYDTVIKQEFLIRLNGKVNFDSNNEHAERARDLATEYQRKVLPLPRRIALPELSSYLQNDRINLVDKDRILLPLPILRYWIEALLNERVNGEENSFQRLPLQTVREMAQFIQSTQDLLPELNEFLHLDEVVGRSFPTLNLVRRRMFMPMAIAKAVDDFSSQYNDALSFAPQEGRKGRTSREHAYQNLREAVKDLSGTMPENHADFLLRWYRAMCEYFYYQINGATAFLTAKTNVVWLNPNDIGDQSVLSLDLFQPQNYHVSKYPHFSTPSQIREPWSKALNGKVPSIWLERLPERTPLAYPIPERGRHISPERSNEKQVEINIANEASWPEVEFVRKLVIHWSFYSPNQRSNLILTGRVFELVISSLVRDLTIGEVYRIIERPPFYSIAAMASTKVLTISDEQISDDDSQESVAEVDEQLLEDFVENFVAEVNAWRLKNRLKAPNSWFIYNILNKYFNQTGFFNNPDRKPAVLHLRDVVATGLQAFNSIWSASGSFEKGDIFGLSRVIANVNMTDADKDFMQSVLYKQNILPFLQEKTGDEHFDFMTGSITYALASHPLKAVLNSAFKGFPPTLNQLIVKKDLDGFSVPPSLEELEKLNAVVRKVFKENPQFKIIRSLSRQELNAVISLIRKASRSDGLMNAFDYATSNVELTPRSAAKKLQKCFQRLQASVSSSSNKQ